MPRQPKFIHPLRTVRKAAGNISQTQLGLLIGVTRDAVQSFELGRLPISREVALRIAQALGVDPQSIVTPTDEPRDIWGKPYTEASWKNFKGGRIDVAAPGAVRAAIGNYGALKSKLDAVFRAAHERRKGTEFLIALNAWIDEAREDFNVAAASEKLMRDGYELEREAKKLGMPAVQLLAMPDRWPRYFR